MLHAPGLARSRSIDDVDIDRAIEDFAVARPRLHGIAHRMLGSWAEAEDVVQETWVRWQRCDRRRVVSPTAFLVTTTTRLAINAAQSARSRHETYVDDWRPHPVDVAEDPSTAPERGEALGAGLLVLIRMLSPTERAAYILRHAFDYPYSRIADVLETTEVNARQIVSRAGKHLADECRRTVDPADAQRLAHAFVAAAHHGELGALEEVLVEDVGSSPIRVPPCLVRHPDAPDGPDRDR
jgi:RNA polymerase sigma-70 factor (ECF subfamily)